MRFRGHAALVLCLLIRIQAIRGQQSACPDTVSQPMMVQGGAPIVSVTFEQRNGTPRLARFVFDSGGSAIILDEKLANDVGLEPTGEAVTDGVMHFMPTRSPAVRFGSWLATLSTSRAFIHLGQGSFDTRELVEGLLPGKALEPYEVLWIIRTAAF